MILYGILYEIPRCLLQLSFNYHCASHETTIMGEPILEPSCSNHGSPVFPRFEYPMVNSPTHSPKSLYPFLMTVKDKPCRLEQCSIHYVTIWEV